MIHSYTIYRLIPSKRLSTISLIAIVLLLMCSMTSQAQQSTIKGSILDSNGNPINGAVVLCSDAAGQIISHDVSTSEGTYKVTSEDVASVELSVTHLSYEEIHTQVEITGAETIKDFVLQQSSTLLDEIMIKADYKKRDTVAFSLKNLNLKEADNLKKILEKIPNFLVGDDGVILYEGKTINKILVNNEVAFINQNTTALNSVQAKMVENLEVIHNHQNVFQLDFDEVQETVLNIDTKESFKNIFSGLVEAEYGTSNTYNLSGDLMKFSKGLNVITTHNVNSIGKKEMEQREVQSLFRPNSTFSYYQENLLQYLFEEREDFTSNLFSHSNATFRKRNKKLKIDGTLYRISNKITQSSIFEVEDLDQTFFAENKSTESIEGNSFLGHISMAYKVGPKSIISYDIYGNKLKGNDNSSVIADQKFLINDTTTRVDLLGMRDIQSTNIDQSINYHNKFSSKNIFFITGRMANESSRYLGSNTVNDVLFAPENGYDFKKSLRQTNVGIKSKFANYFMSSLTLDYTVEDEEIISPSVNDINRKRSKSSAIWKAWGDVYKKFDYKMSSSLISENHVLADGKPIHFVYAPVSIAFDYERRKHNWLIQYNKNFRTNKLEQSLNIMEPLQYNSGTIENINKLNTIENAYLQYTYNDIFEGERLQLRIYRNKRQHDNALYFIENQNGVSIFNWFNYNENSTIGIRSNASKVIMPLKFATKIDVSFNYNKSILPINELENTNRDHFSTSLTLKTVTNKKVNYSLKSQFAKLIDSNTFSEQRYTFFANNFSVNYYDKKWDCSVNLIQENHWINGTTRNRWNVNTNLSYIIGKYTISLDIRHLGELFSIIDNDTYNYTYSQEGGLVYRSQRDQSLRYALLGIKYIF